MFCPGEGAGVTVILQGLPWRGSPNPSNCKPGGVWLGLPTQVKATRSRGGGTRETHFGDGQATTSVTARGLVAVVLPHQRHQTQLASSPSKCLKSNFGKSIYIYWRMCVSFYVTHDVTLFTTTKHNHLWLTPEQKTPS